jgi:hypothetical protein
VTTIGADQDRELTTLEMAQNLAASVHRAALESQADQTSSYLNRTGDRAHAAAQLAANLALVSIAEDFRRVADVLCKADRVISQQDGEPGAVADARATREHMRSWGAGETTHPGEGQL